MDDENIKRTQVIKSYQQINHLTAENKRMQEQLSRHIRGVQPSIALAAVSPLARRNTQETVRPDLSAMVTPNPAVKTNELLSQLVSQNKQLTEEIVQQRQVLHDQSKLMDLMVQAMRVLSADLATLISRVSIDERPSLDDDSTDESSSP